MSKQVQSSIPCSWRDMLRAHLSISRNICVMWEPIMNRCGCGSNPDRLNASHFPAAKSPPERGLLTHTRRQLSPGEQPLPLNLYDKPFPRVDQSVVHGIRRIFTIPMHSGKPPNGDLFHWGKEKGNLSWLLPSWETGVIHTYQQTIQNTEGETEGFVVVDNDSRLNISSCGKVCLHPEFFFILLPWQLSNINSSRVFAHPIHVM